MKKIRHQNRRKLAFVSMGAMLTILIAVLFIMPPDDVAKKETVLIFLSGFFGGIVMNYITGVIYENGKIVDKHKDIESEGE